MLLFCRLPFLYVCHITVSHGWLVQLTDAMPSLLCPLWNSSRLQRVATSCECVNYISRSLETVVQWTSTTDAPLTGARRCTGQRAVDTSWPVTGSYVTAPSWISPQTSQALFPCTERLIGDIATVFDCSFSGMYIDLVGYCEYISIYIHSVNVYLHTVLNKDTINQDR